ncbi:MAG: hypothetical protein V1489_01735 [Candidatus Liptonbacteria bacterium]
MDPFTISWSAPEFEYHAKGVYWYWTSIAVAVIVIAISVWQKNFLFGLFVVIAEILILVWGEREPQDTDFVLNEKGLEIKGYKFYPTREIGSFSSFEDWSDLWSTIILDPKGHFQPAVRIHVPRVRFPEIERGFRAIAPLVHKDISLVDALEKFLGF